MDVCKIRFGEAAVIELISTAFSDYFAYVLIAIIHIADCLGSGILE